jgi:hypothetical protein
MNHSEYTTFFRTIAEKHVDIQHSEEESHFSRVIVSGGPFRDVIIEEFLNQLRSEIHTPFMLLESYDADYEDNRADQLMKAYHGAFILLDKPENDDFNSIEAVISNMELIGEDIMGYIKNELRKPRPDSTNRENYFVNMNDWTSEKVGKISNLFYGVRFDFTFRKTANSNLVYKPEKFN